jgi:hypothetical protein
MSDGWERTAEEIVRGLVCQFDVVQVDIEDGPIIATLSESLDVGGRLGMQITARLGGFKVADISHYWDSD